MEMPSETLKSFAALHDDYAFFESHSSETEATLAAWLPLLAGLPRPLHALDFGAGSGSFTSIFLQSANIPPEDLSLTLIEPDAGYRAEARDRLTPFTVHPIAERPLLDEDLEPSFDLIFSHHVLYYVPNLEETLRRLNAALRPGGRLLLVQGGAKNELNALVWNAFELLGEKAPYNYSEDTRAALHRLEISHRVEMVSSVHEFPDSPENRWKILRFLLGEHLKKLAPEQALALYEPFQHQSNIRFACRDELFIIDA